MSKKIWIPISLAIVAALVFAGVAFAEDKYSPEGQRGRRQGIGLVTAIGDDQITVQTLQGETHTILVDENTRFFFPDGSPASFSDVQVGNWIAGRVRRGENETILARSILILPEGFDPTQVTLRTRGAVTVVDPDASTFTIENQDGEMLTFSVDANTVFLGAVQSLADLQVEMVVGVAASDSSGAWFALAVHAHQPLIRHRGEVTAVDVAAGTFSIETRAGEALTFAVDEQTRFHSPNGAIGGLEDLQPGMLAGVAALQLEDGSYLAVNVAAAHPDDLPQFDLRVRGMVTAVTETSFTIQNRQGETYTFQVTEETRFRSPGGFVRSLEDLEVGMRVGVGADELDTGFYVAQVVIAVRGATEGQ